MPGNELGEISSPSRRAFQKRALSSSVDGDRKIASRGDGADQGGPPGRGQPHSGSTRIPGGPDCGRPSASNCCRAFQLHPHGRAGGGPNGPKGLAPRAGTMEAPLARKPVFSTEKGSIRRIREWVRSHRAFSMRRMTLSSNRGIARARKRPKRRCWAPLGPVCEEIEFFLKLIACAGRIRDRMVSSRGGRPRCRARQRASVSHLGESPISVFGLRDCLRERSGWTAMSICLRCRYVWAPCGRRARHMNMTMPAFASHELTLKQGPGLDHPWRRRVAVAGAKQPPGGNQHDIAGQDGASAVAINRGAESCVLPPLSGALRQGRSCLWR